VDHTLQAGGANQPVMTPEEQGYGAGTQILGSGSSSRHIKFLSQVPQPCVRRRAIKTVLPNSTLKIEKQLAGFRLEKFFHALEINIKC